MNNDHERLLLTLLRHNGSLGNGKARELLGWDEATYEQVKQALVASGQVAIGRGRGDSISLVATGQEANKPNSPEAAEPKASKPKAVKPEASSRAAEKPLGQEANRPKSQVASKPLSQETHGLKANKPLAGTHGAHAPIIPVTRKCRKAERLLGPMAYGIKDFGATPYSIKYLADELRA